MILTRSTIISVSLLAFLGTGAVDVPRSVIYSFHENLANAQAFLIEYVKPNREYEERRREKTIGQWRDGKIVFEDFKNEAPIAVHANLYEGIEEQAIFFSPSEGKIKSIQFYEVPPASKLEVYYGIDDLGAELNLNATIYMTIRVGDRKIKRLLVPYGKGWKRAVIDLGVVSFFKMPLVVSFEITTDDPNVRRFSFRAYMVE